MWGRRAGAPSGHDQGPRPRLGFGGVLEQCAAERGPKKVPRLGRVPVRKTPSLAIGGSAHSRPITSRTGNTLVIRFWSRSNAPGHAGGVSQPRCRGDRRLCPGGAGSANPSPANLLWPGSRVARVVVTPAATAWRWGLWPRRSSPLGERPRAEAAARRFSGAAAVVARGAAGVSATGWAWPAPRPRSGTRTSVRASPRATAVPRGRTARGP